jgi:hypothetical protein
MGQVRLQSIEILSPSGQCPANKNCSRGSAVYGLMKDGLITLSQQGPWLADQGSGQ